MTSIPGELNKGVAAYNNTERSFIRGSEARGSGRGPRASISRGVLSTALWISSAERTLESSPALSALGFSIYLSARPRLHEGGLTTDAAVAKRYFLKDSYLDLQSLNPLFALRCSVPYLPKRELMATIPAQSFRCLLLTLPIIEWSHSRANRKL